MKQGSLYGKVYATGKFMRRGSSYDGKVYDMGKFMGRGSLRYGKVCTNTEKFMIWEESL